ncbi:MAG: hypothetical protein A3B74_02265 [Candidatus Kerfeldbacteria bacterium RIFCSPHIGHO2_02_FULL_42_14]|uniref:DUF8128 domain-containing protein n=1 Tax=Candidatus Kerfeldbacteria bacterium RIFCSPHIGHO2_02_FULL_42_14 TaxID=1798540 RepID=A0A1G2ASR6_9BACT|nr:MAG: hypothetical protein A3B74_02265 [Candidatus Kerfeldbacteria bacterium RIFCSPHIGHO2_02_FULL_42_14]OGY83802.1 MAG: hypothetical protein A3I91_04410 [Candidatus Kerfeldbacteria bacterium RIFCSPLOWO2_02_FULL_42_19]OGY87131.1 MAG: hypothetical protein A3G01_04600 [Candidatus Kerfeldbacteria bacterium RIFCSPLOWO2_12_FULL_43_9]
MSTFEIFILVLGYIAIALALIGALIQLYRWYFQKITKTSKAFEMIPLLVTVPKESKDEEDKQKEIKDRIAPAETLYATLGGVRAQRGWKHFWFGRNDHFALEIVADSEGLISFYVVVPRYMQQYVEQQIHAQYDEAQIEEVPDYNVFSKQGIILGAYLTLKKRYIFPIQTYDKLQTDPLNALTNVLSKMGQDEGAAIQCVIRSARPEWHALPAKLARTMQQGKKLEEAMKEVTGSPFGKVFWFLGASLFQSRKKDQDKDEPQKHKEYHLSPAEEEIVKGLEAKTSLAGFDVNIRIIVSALQREQAEARLRNILNVFTQYAGYQYGNSFAAHTTKEKARVINDFIYRHFDERHKFLLNAREMASLYHFPLETTDTPNIRWLMAKKAPPPANLPKDGLLLGKAVYRGIGVPVRIKRDDRRRHVYIIGKSGAGKSVLLQNMVIQDIENGEGVCVIDPHGELVEDMLPYIPRERADDLIVFNPSDIERPIGLNMLEYATDEEKDFAVQEMIAIFYKLFGQELIGPMFEHYMRNAMLALMEDKESGATVLEIPRMFTDKKFRQEKLRKVRNPMVKNFWEQEYEQSQRGTQAADMLSYVISKIGRFLSNDMMRNIIGQQNSGFNFREIMDHQKIFLINLSKGTTGEVNSSLLGLILVSKLQMAALGRANIKASERKDFYLYIDEFQNYITDSIGVILSEARKYRLNLTIAHQYISQLVQKGNDTSIRDAVFGNVGTLIAFRIGVEDAEILAKEFAPVFNENDVMNVEQFTANIKILIDNTASRSFNMKTLLPEPTGDLELAAKLKELSRLKYGRDRRIVEAEILERSKLDQLVGGSVGVTPDSVR